MAESSIITKETEKPKKLEEHIEHNSLEMIVTQQHESSGAW